MTSSNIRTGRPIVREWMLALFLLFLTGQAFAGGWEKLATGLELGRFHFPGASENADSMIVVLRIDPVHFEASLHSATEQPDQEGLSTREWAKKHDLTVVINSGMYDEDRRRHIGMLITPDHQNNPVFHSSYQSLFVFQPRKSQQKDYWSLIDLDESDIEAAKINYGCLVQNLRLIKHPRENRWSRNGKRWWSEAALGVDSKGHLLLLYTPAVVTMYDFNEALLALPIDLQAAQHLEGGLQAQLYIETENRVIEFHTGHKTDFEHHPDAGPGLPIPNVLGFRKR